MANDVILDLGNEYIGSAYSPVVEITENEDGHTISITSADPDAAGHLVTNSFDVPNYSDEEAGREAAEAMREAYEAQRQAAEDAREASESARQAAESSRASAETSREVAESIRRGQEQGRAQAEQYRRQNETLRQQDERARQDAEAARYSAEQDRAAAETARDAAESERQLAEQAREDAEDARQAAEQARETASATAVANAEAATSAANTATQQAQAATTAANDAAETATTAAGTANTAAAAADTAREGIQDDLAQMRSDIADKAFVDAYVPLLTAGAALGITGDGPTETAAWLQRTSTSDGPTTAKSIHGRTVRWNQNAPAYDSNLWVVGGKASISTEGTALKLSNRNAAGSQCRAKATNFTIPTNHYIYIAGTIDASHIASGVTALRLYASGGAGSNVGSSGISVDAGTGKARYSFITATSTEGASLACAIPATGEVGTEYALFSDMLCIDLTLMFGAGSEPSTVAEFEALYPLPYYPYDAGSLLPVRMEGIETTGFNQWDESWEVGAYNASGNKTSSSTNIRSAGYITVFPSTTYYHKVGGVSQTTNVMVNFYDDDKAFISRTYSANATFETPDNCRYVTFYCGSSYGTTYNHDICINLSDPTRNGTYEPYWNQERTIPAGTLRGADTVYDELTETERITRVGEVDLGNQNWSKSGDYFYTIIADKAVGAYNITCSKYPTSTDGSLDNGECIGNSNNNRVSIMDTSYTDAATFKAEMSGVMLHYALAEPTTVEIDPPLNLTYRTAAGGTERVMVPTGEISAPPTIVTAQGYTAESLRDAALSAIAPVENGLASTNYAVGSYLVHGGQLCKVTTAIATGESISIGTNVTTTTVMAEVLSLTQ